MSAWALVGAPVWTGPDEGVRGDAIGFGSDGTVVCVGSTEEVLAALPSGAAAVPARGGAVVPGFVDAHVHLRASAWARLAVDCSAVASARELLALVRAHADRHPVGAEPLALVGLEPVALRGGLPTRAQLDRAAPGIDVRIRLRSLHGWLLSTAALRRAGVAAGTPDLVVDHAGGLARALGPPGSRERFEEALGAWSRDALRDGVVAVLDASVTNGEREVDAIRRWHERGLVHQAVGALRGDAGAGADGLKVMPRPGRELSRQLARSIAQGWAIGATVAVHCTDTETLAALVEVVEAIPSRRRGRLRIEHASVCPAEWVPRVAALGATVVTHPGFVTAHGDRYLTTVDDVPRDWLYRLASWDAHGVELAFGSDAPAGPAAPATAWAGARSRRTASGRVLGPAEALSGEATLIGLTSAAADASGLTGYGRLRAGGPGAAVVLAEDPLRAPATSELRVVDVIAGGRIVR